jgi:hypothetical protein
MNTTAILTLALAGVVGALAGTHAAIWGMYKDAAHEGFAARTFARSVVIGVLAGVALQLALHLALPTAGAIALLFGLAYGTERGLVETWKTFVREEDQSKYFIPMQFSFRGTPVTRRGPRLAMGALYVCALAACLAAIRAMDTPGQPLHTGRTVLAGLVVGCIIAIGGGWKDAPKEGFDLLKFFRSPVMTVVYTLLLAPVAHSYFLAAVAAIGYERGTAETYKTFFFPSKPRGKFFGMPILHPQMLERRKRFVPPYVAICLGVAACLVSTL